MTRDEWDEFRYGLGWTRRIRVETHAGDIIEGNILVISKDEGLKLDNTKGYINYEQIKEIWKL